MKETDLREIAIVFSSSDYYSILMGVAICSIFENKKSEYPINIFVIDNGISHKNKSRLNVLEKKYGFDITYVSLDKEIFSGISFDTFPIEVYQRIGMARVLPAKYRKVVYLDCDMIIRHDIRSLLMVDLEGKTVGAVADCYQEKRLEHLKKLHEIFSFESMPSTAVYFNSGMLIVDLDRWKKGGVEDKILQILRKNSDKIAAADQDALNIIFLNDHKELPQKYNFLVGATDTYEKNPTIIHFAGGSKPWYFFSALPYQSEYVLYANKTPWRYEKYKKIMDIFFAKKYHLYSLLWTVWTVYKKIKRYIFGGSVPVSFLPNE